MTEDSLDLMGRKEASKKTLEISMKPCLRKAELKKCHEVKEKWINDKCRNIDLNKKKKKKRTEQTM